MKKEIAYMSHQVTLQVTKVEALLLSHQQCLGIIGLLNTLIVQSQVDSWETSQIAAGSQVRDDGELSFCQLGENQWQHEQDL